MFPAQSYNLALQLANLVTPFFLDHNRRSYGALIDKYRQVLKILNGGFSLALIMFEHDMFELYLEYFSLQYPLALCSAILPLPCCFLNVHFFLKAEMRVILSSSSHSYNS